MTKSTYVLVTGGCGYIGSHTCIELLATGSYKLIVIDNMVNSSAECLRRVEEISKEKVIYYSVNLLDKDGIRGVFEKHDISMVLHFAGLKAVGESCDKPMLYYHNNLTGTINLVQTMQEFGVKNIVFSSSATVYGLPKQLPIDETHPAGQCTNPYGKTKYFIEEMLADTAKSDSKFNVVLLRYFNPVGAHKSGLIGEDPSGPPNNLMPYVAQVAVKRRHILSVFGNDYDTPDGTGVRDYIHVVDLAKGHVAALKCFSMTPGCRVYNLGTGQGYSVLDMVTAFEKASGQKVPYKMADRRAGDVASVYADPSLAERELGWKAEIGLHEMCEDLWRWQSKNPTGFSAVSD